MLRLHSLDRNLGQVARVTASSRLHPSLHILPCHASDAANRYMLCSRKHCDKQKEHFCHWGGTTEIAAAREGVPTLLRGPVALLGVAGSRVSIHSRLVCHVLLPILQVTTVHTSAPAHP